MLEIITAVHLNLCPCELDVSVLTWRLEQVLLVLLHFVGCLDSLIDLKYGCILKKLNYLRHSFFHHALQCCIPTHSFAHTDLHL